MTRVIRSPAQNRSSDDRGRRSKHVEEDPRRTHSRDRKAAAREELQNVYAELLTEYGINHGDISPGEFFAIEQAEEMLGAAVGSWIATSVEDMEEEAEEQNAQGD